MGSDFFFQSIFRPVFLVVISISWSFGQTTIEEGEVFGTWSKSGSPYVVNGNLTIPENQKLTIEPGINVEFTGSYSLVVNGCLIAVGTETDSILFTSSDTTGYYNRSHTGWKGIRFQNVNHPDSSRIEFSIVEYGKSTSSVTDEYGGAVLCRNFSKLVLKNSTLRKNQSFNGGAIALTDVGQIKLADLKIIHNYSNNYGGAIYSYNSSCILQNCELIGNEAYGDGGGIYFNTSDAFIRQCLIVNNKSHWGGTIKAHWLNTINIESSTLAGNRGAPDGIDLYRSDLQCRNSILWNKSEWNTYDEISAIDYSNVLLDFCIVKGDPDEEWIMNNCSSEDPKFVDLEKGNVNLSWDNYPDKDSSKSIAIDAGDPSNDHDPDGTIADIGGVPYGQSSNAFPTASFTADTTQKVVPFAVNFTDYSTQAFGNILTWLWDFGDGKFSTEKDPVHLYEESGVYDVKLAITNQDGKKDSLTRIDYINALGGTIINSNEIFGVWTKEKSPYNIYNDVEIPNGKSLVIEPGVSIVFFGYHKLSVNGSLQAKGSVNDSIVFTRFNEKSGWHSIRFEDTPSENDSSIFEYCKIEYTNYPGGNVTTNGGNALYVKNFDKVRISNSLLQNNRGGRGAGIYCDKASIKIYHNHIRNNWTDQYGAGINVENCSPLILGNTIEENYAGANAGGISFKNSKSIAEGNIVKNNSCYWSGAGIVISESDIQLVKNIISNNESGHDDGGGLAIYTCNPMIINNTICHNKAEDGEGVYISGNSKPEFINNIIYFNRDLSSDSNDSDEIFLNSKDSQPNFYNCNIQGGIEGINLYSGSFEGIAENNINLDPLFTDTLNFYYTLKWDGYSTWDKSRSPCIDAGKFDSKHDPDGSISDMGALYFHQEGKKFPPRPDFKADTLLGFNTLKVLFTDLSDPGTGNVASWEWDFGDGNTSSMQNPIHEYLSPGIYSISLAIVDENGFKETKTLEDHIHIYEGTYLKGEVEGQLSDKKYLIGGDLIVPDGKKLVIDPGVELMFFGNYKVEVLGSMEAIGKENSRITFTYYDTLGLSLIKRFPSTDAGWNGIKIVPTSINDSTIIDYCKIEHVNSFNGGAIYLDQFIQKGVRISNSEICYNSTQGIITGADNLVINNNYIHHNYPQIYGMGAGIYCYSGTPIIKNNIICSNHAMDDGGGISMYDGRPMIINNVICHNYAPRGGGISTYTGAITMINNTICFNTADGDGGGFFTIYANKSTFVNCVLSKNVPEQVHISDPNTGVGFSHTILEGGKNKIRYYTENIFLYENIIEDSAKVSPAIQAHARLLPGAAAIDAGTLTFNGDSLDLPERDIMSNLRIKDGKVDIGAYEYYDDTHSVLITDKIGQVDKDEDFETFYIGLDSIFGYPLGNQFIDFEITNQGEISLVDASIKNHHLEVVSKPDRFGETSVVIYASDGIHDGIYDTLSLIINPINDVPTFTLSGNLILDEDFEEVNFQALPDSVPFGEENQGLSYSISPESVDFADINFNAVSGSMTISAKENAYGSQEFVITVDDGQDNFNTYSQSFIFTVCPVNDAPNIDSTIEEFEIQAGEVINFEIAVSDAENDEISLTIVSGDQSIVSNDSISIVENEVNKYSIEISTSEEAEGVTALSIQASDGDAFSYSSISGKVISVHITATNDKVHTLRYLSFPNPVKDLLHIETEEPAEAELCNLNGETLMKINLIKGGNELNLKSMSSGVYLLKIDHKTGSEILKIVKN